jgi:hypothetical protein
MEGDGMSALKRSYGSVSALLFLILMGSESGYAEPFAPVGGLEVNLRSTQYFSATDLTKLNKAFVVLTQVLNSAEFRDFVLNYNYQSTGTFANSGGFDNEAIYNLVQDGKEAMLGIVDHTIDLDLVLYNPPWYRRWGVVGYTYANTNKIWMNRNYFNRFEPSDVAANIAHEWMHKIGFDHDYKSTKRRPYSVPYAVGNFVSQFGAKLSP